MMSARRLGRARHEFRFGGRELVVLGGVFCLIAGLVFAVGVVVGREMARAKAARAEAREHRLAGPEGLPGAEGPVKTAATRTEEKVTFYRTLTAPTQDLPQVGKPTIEERLIPKEEPLSASPPPTSRRRRLWFPRSLLRPCRSGGRRRPRRRRPLSGRDRLSWGRRARRRSRRRGPCR